MRGLLLSCFVFASALAGAADYFSRANDEYEAGRYERAVVLYDSALHGVADAAIYYNRGNAWFRLGRVGKAIADYNRAFLLAPRDPAIRHNLAFARKFRPDRWTVTDNAIVRALTDGLRMLNSSLAKIVAGGAFFFVMVGVGLFLLFAKRFFLWLGIGFAVVACYGWLSMFSWKPVRDPNRVVVVVPEATIRAGPGPEYKEIAVVHDGLEAIVRERRLLEEDSVWMLLQMPGGTGGWVEGAALEQIFVR